MSISYAKVFIDQIKPDPSYVSVIDEDKQWSSSTSIGDFEILEAEFNAVYFPLVQNPRPGFGSLNYLTEQGDDWSDSPTLNPSLPDKKRYSYGRRGTERYGSLDLYSGLVIKQTVAETDGDFNIYNVKTHNDISEYCLAKYIEGEVLIEETELPSNDIIVYQYNFVVFSRPKAFSYKNPVDTDVSIRLANYVFPLNSGTVTLSLGGENKSGLEVTPFYSGLGGFDATWYNNVLFDYDEQVDVVWTVYDTAIPPNLITIKYWFRTLKDLVGPRISNIYPLDDSTGVAVNTCISFDIEDFELGVNIDSLELYVNNIEIPHSSMTIEEIDRGYSVSYCTTTDYLYGDVIAVSIYVEDSSPDKNSLFHVFSFTTKESDKPLFISGSPREFSDRVTMETDVGVIVSDGGAGIGDSDTYLEIDGVKQEEATKLPIIYRQS